MVRLQYVQGRLEFTEGSALVYKGCPISLCVFFIHELLKSKRKIIFIMMVIIITM